MPPKIAKKSNARYSLSSVDDSLDSHFRHLPSGSVSKRKSDPVERKTNKRVKRANADAGALHGRPSGTLDGFVKKDVVLERNALDDISGEHSRKLNSPSKQLPTPGGSAKKVKVLESAGLESDSSASSTHVRRRSKRLVGRDYQQSANPSPVSLQAVRNARSIHLPSPPSTMEFTRTTPAKQPETNILSGSTAEMGSSTIAPIVHGDSRSRATPSSLTAAQLPTPLSMLPRKSYNASSSSNRLPAFSHKLRESFDDANVESSTNLASVPSSQSQHIIPFAYSPERRGRRTNSDEWNSDCEPIPSSQSQYIIPYVASPEKRTKKLKSKRSPQFKRPAPIRISPLDVTKNSSDDLEAKEDVSCARSCSIVPTSQSEEEELEKEMSNLPFTPSVRDARTKDAEVDSPKTNKDRFDSNFDPNAMITSSPPSPTLVERRLSTSTNRSPHISDSCNDGQPTQTQQSAVTEPESWTEDPFEDLRTSKLLSPSKESLSSVHFKNIPSPERGDQEIRNKHSHRLLTKFDPKSFESELQTQNSSVAAQSQVDDACIQSSATIPESWSEEPFPDLRNNGRLALSKALPITPLKIWSGASSDNSLKHLPSSQTSVAEPGGGDEDVSHPLPPSPPPRSTTMSSAASAPEPATAGDVFEPSFSQFSIPDFGSSDDSYLLTPRRARSAMMALRGHTDLDTLESPVRDFLCIGSFGDGGEMSQEYS